MNKPKVNEISPTLFEVLGYSIKLQTRRGRTLLLCSCTNSSYFANNNFCYHKELVIEHILKQPIKDEVDKLIKEYEGYTSIKVPLEPRVILNDLKNLRKII